MIIPTRKKKDTPPPPPPPEVKVKPLGEVSREHGVLFLTNEFNDENITPLIRQIIDWNLQDSDPPELITLYINSPGGAVHNAFHLIDTMKQSKIPVSTVAMGLAASCGCLTLMAGAKGKRYITHNTSVMSHQYSWGSSGKEHELMGKIKEFELSSERMLRHYSKCTGKSITYIRKHLLGETDVWLSPEEVVRHGIVDEVITTY